MFQQNILQKQCEEERVYFNSKFQSTLYYGGASNRIEGYLIIITYPTRKQKEEEVGLGYKTAKPTPVTHFLQ